MSDKPAKDKAKKDKGEDKGKGKDKKAKKDKKGKGTESGGLSVAAHPRASAQVRKAKGWGGLAAFVITGYLSLSHGATADIAGMRALVAGVAGYVLAWGCAVMVWRQLMVAEIRAKVERARVRSEEAAAAAVPAPGTEPSAR
ncbi:MAG: hypothetical protein QOG59_467 [Solirubrobacteraceae bacterium]|jgi:uncharacterized oligopeptide transporter (OPT) family protein|nr:hypothetical protein [Solirubrobacteraceae bacterium]